MVYGRALSFFAGRPTLDVGALSFFAFFLGRCAAAATGTSVRTAFSAASASSAASAFFFFAAFLGLSFQLLPSLSWFE